MNAFYSNKRKYRNQKMMVDGMMFDSKHEAQRYVFLKQMEKDGYIRNLRCQVEYVLIPEQREASSETYKKGLKKGEAKPGKLIEKKCSYIADFVYHDNETGLEVVEDAKGMRTKDYIIKRKLMLWLKGIRIVEV